MFDDIPRPTCRSVYTVSDKHLRHGGSGYETKRYHADPVKKRSAKRKSYDADPEKKRSAKRESYEADPEKKRSAKPITSQQRKEI